MVILHHKTANVPEWFLVTVNFFLKDSVTALLLDNYIQQQIHECAELQVQILAKSLNIFLREYLKFLQNLQIFVDH